MSSTLKKLLCWQCNCKKNTQNTHVFNHGFTLLELIIVCFLLGLTLSFTVPALRSSLIFDDLRESARKITGMISEVRELAERTNTRYILYLSSSEGKIWYAEAKNNEAETASYLWPHSVSLDYVLLDDERPESLENIAVPVNAKGQIKQLVMKLESTEGQALTLQFYTFLRSAKIQK